METPVGGDHNQYWFWEPVEEDDRRDNVARPLQELGQVEYERQRAIGRQLSIEQATALALGRIDPMF